MVWLLELLVHDHLESRTCREDVTDDVSAVVCLDRNVWNRVFYSSYRGLDLDIDSHIVRFIVDNEVVHSEPVICVITHFEIFLSVVVNRSLGMSKGHRNFTHTLAGICIEYIGNIGNGY